MLNPVLTIPSGASQVVDDPMLGIGATEITLGFPSVRDDSYNRPAQSGMTDFTRFTGGRNVSITLTVWPSANQSLDDVVARFSPFLQPDIVTTLTYSMDSFTGPVVRRSIAMRVADYSAPLQNSWNRSLQMQWLAPDPNVYDIVTKSVSIIPASMMTGVGRTYDPATAYYNNQDRAYQVPGTAIGPSIQNAGDRPTWPTVTFYGPMGNGSQPTVFSYTLADPVTGAVMGGKITFVPSFVLSNTDVLVVSVQSHNVTLNGTGNRFGLIDFGNTVWAPLLPADNYVDPSQVEYITGLSAAAVTPDSRVDVTWRDAYLL